MPELTTKQIVLIAYGAYLILLSIITFIAYGADKKKQKTVNIEPKKKRYYAYHSLVVPSVAIQRCSSLDTKPKGNTGISPRLTY